MARESFENKKLHERTVNWTEDSYVYEICIVKPITDRLIFETKLLSRPTSLIGGEFGGQLKRPDGTDRLDIPVEEDCRIEFRLCNGLKWRWNEQMAVGSGDERVLHYFNLEYWDEATSRWGPAATGGRYKRVRFCAEKKARPPVDHPINLNVLLEYSDTEVLPVTLDPDIQNPRS